MASDLKKHVIVIGAGVIGLQTALTLLRAGYDVSIVAEWWPGEAVGGYTSDWAGAHWRTHALTEEVELCAWDTDTYRAWELQVEEEKRQSRIGESGLGVRKSLSPKYLLCLTWYANLLTVKQVYTSLHYWEAPAPEISNGASSLWWSSVVSDFKVIHPAELPSGVHYGVSFSTFAVNVPQYLKHLLASIGSVGGRTFQAKLPTACGIDKALDKAKEVAGGRHVHAYINASGIGAKELAGDLTVSPIRGQTVLVKGEAKYITTRLGKGKNDIRIIIPRPGSGCSIAGVTKEPGVWDTAVNDESVRKILEGCKKLAPELLREDTDFEVVSVNVGLRPTRKDGPRVETEILIGGKLVIHEYGHSGAGYQNSIGSANKVLQLIKRHEKAHL